MLILKLNITFRDKNVPLTKRGVVKLSLIEIVK